MYWFWARTCFISPVISFLINKPEITMLFQIIIGWNKWVNVCKKHLTCNGQHRQFLYYFEIIINISISYLKVFQMPLCWRGFSILFSISMELSLFWLCVVFLHGICYILPSHILHVKKCKSSPKCLGVELSLIYLPYHIEVINTW